MAIHNVTVDLSAIAIFMMNSSDVVYLGAGTAATSGTTSMSVAYPSGAVAGNIVVFAGGFKKHTDIWSGVNYNAAGWAMREMVWIYEVDATQRTRLNNTLGTDKGGTRVEHHLRSLTASASGSETFSTSGTNGNVTNISAAGQTLLFGKPASLDWIVKSYGDNDSCVGSDGVPKTFLEHVNPSYTYKIGPSSITGIANNPGVCTLAISGTTVYRTLTGGEWKQLGQIYGGFTPNRLRFGNGVFIACGNGWIARSTNNGDSWTVMTASPISAISNYQSLKYHNGRWVLPGYYGDILVSSDDGQTWTRSGMSPNNHLMDCTWYSGKKGARAAWNNGNGIWWVVGEGMIMWRSDDNGVTWQQGAYYTGSYLEWNNTSWTSFDPRAIFPLGNAESATDFCVYSEAAGDYAALGTGNYYVWGAWSIGSPQWQTRWAGYYTSIKQFYRYYGQDLSAQPYGRWPNAYDVATISGSKDTNNYWTVDFALASSFDDGINLAQGWNTGPTNRPTSLKGRRITHQRLGRPWLSSELRPGIHKDHYNAQGYKRFFRSGGAESYAEGFNDGRVVIRELTGIWENEGLESERPYGGEWDTIDVRDGDMIVVTLSVSDTADTISAMNLVYEVAYAKGEQRPIFFSPMTVLSPVTSTSGDKVRVYTGYCYALGEQKITYGPDNWQLDHPAIFLTWTNSATSVVSYSYSYVVTVIRASSLTTIFTDVVAKMTVESEVRKVGIMPGAPGSLYIASMTVDAYVEKSSTPVYLQDETSNSEVSGTTMTVGFSISGGPVAGTLVVVFVAADNLSATTPTVSVTDASGNTYTQIGFRGQNASAAAGIVTALFYSILTYDVPSPGQVTVTFSGAIVCKAVATRSYAGMAGATLANSAVNSGSSATPTVTSGTVNTGDLVVVANGVENTASPGTDTDTLNGPWNSLATSTGSGGNATTHISLTAAHKIVTGAGAQTFNQAGAASTDWASVIGVIRNPPTQYTAAVIRTKGTLSADMTVNRAYNTTGAISATASLTATATVVEGTAPVSSTIVTGNMTSTALRLVGLSTTLTETGNLTATANLSTIHSATATLTTVVSGTVLGGVGMNAAAALSVYADRTAAQGSVITATASCTTGVEMRNVESYVINSNTVGYPNGPDMPPTPVDPPVPGTWHTFSTQYGPTGSVGNPVELTNRHYWEAIESSKYWPQWPFPNGPAAQAWGIPTCGVTGISITPLGNDKFLATWIQENWTPYQFQWTDSGVIDRVLDIPACLVATVLDCTDGDPKSQGSRRYDLPRELRHWRNVAGSMTRPLGDGRVACMWSGILVADEGFQPDLGTCGIILDDPFNIVCVVDASTDIPTFKWHKTIGRLGGSSGFRIEPLVYNNDVYVVAFGTSDVVVHQLSGTTGALQNSSAIMTSLWDRNNGVATCLNDGSQGFVVGDNGSTMIYIPINLATLNWGAPQNILYSGAAIQSRGDMYFSKQGNDGYWYASGTHTGLHMYSIYRLKIDGETVRMESIHMSDTAHDDSINELEVYTFSNAYAAEEYEGSWYSTPNYSNSEVETNQKSNSFCPGTINPSFASMAYETLVDQRPEHDIGPQIVARIPAISEKAVPSRASSWLSPAIGGTTSWDQYFLPTDHYLAEIDIAEMSNGKILVLLGGVSDVVDWEQNGKFRIFTYIADPQNDPPPLKLAQRDDGKVVGGDRLGYDSENSGDIRLGRVAW